MRAVHQCRPRPQWQPRCSGSQCTGVLSGTTFEISSEVTPTIVDSSEPRPPVTGSNRRFDVIKRRRDRRTERNCLRDFIRDRAYVVDSPGPSVPVSTWI